MVRIVLFIFLFCFSFSQVRVDGLVAVVGNNMILHSDIIQQTQLLAASNKIDPTKRPDLFEVLYEKTLENIINQFSILDFAEKDTNLIISDDEVDRVLEQRIDEFVFQAGSRELFEEAVGMPLRQIKLEYWNEIRNMMLIERYRFLKTQTIDVSRIEVNSFFEIHKDSIPLVPENYTFSVVEVPFISGDASEKRVYTFLDSLRNLIIFEGVSFDSLAMKHSQDPGSSSSGGNLGFTSRGTLVQDYEEAAYSLQPGELSLPVRSQFGYHLIKLISRRGEEISSQHILLLVLFSDTDKKTSLEKAEDIYSVSFDDPFVFDSLSVKYNNDFDNYSGIYKKLYPIKIPDILLDHMINQPLYNLSYPIETNDGYTLIFLYEHNPSFFPNPNNSWNLIYEYAKQNKQNIIFQNIINKIKEKTFIKTFY